MTPPIPVLLAVLVVGCAVANEDETGRAVDDASVVPERDTAEDDTAEDASLEDASAQDASPPDEGPATDAEVDAIEMDASFDSTEELDCTSREAGQTDVGGPPQRQGHIVYRAVYGPIYLIEASSGAQSMNLSEDLDRLSAGVDGDINISPDGDWLSLVTTRFGCEIYSCIAVIDVGLRAPELIRMSTGEQVAGEEAVAVASGGDTVVFAAAGAKHQRDLFVVHRITDYWTNPVNITAKSAFGYNTHPAIADDGTSVLFDCGPNPYGAKGTRICEVAIDGSGLTVVVDPANGPNGVVGDRVHSGDYAPDGSIVFEAEWAGEQIWRLRRGEKVPALVGNFGNDNTPCVLPDGRVASLWLNAPSNTQGLHELKLMSSDGSDYVMLVQGLDVLDTTIGCGQ